MQFERKFFIENCQCKEENWECDLGYFREGDGPCRAYNSSKEIDYSPP